MIKILVYPAILWSSVASALSGQAAPAQVSAYAPDEGQAARPHWYLALRDLDERATTVGYRLATANRDLCGDLAPLTGLELGMLSQFQPRDRAGIARAFGFDHRAKVTVVVGNSPAALAGIAVGDTLLAADGVALRPEPATGPATADFAEGARDRVQQASADGLATLEIERAGRRVRLDLHPIPGCAARWILSSSGGLDIGTDGSGIGLSVGLFRIAASDDEVAAVAGHELAHVLLDERAGRPHSLKDRRMREDKADALGTVLMARAGYDPGAAVGFWRHFAERDHLSFLRAPTHRDARVRARQLEKVVKDLRRFGPEQMIHVLLGSGSVICSRSAVVP